MPICSLSFFAALVSVILLSTPEFASARGGGGGGGGHMGGGGGGHFGGGWGGHGYGFGGYRASGWGGRGYGWGGYRGYGWGYPYYGYGLGLGLGVGLGYGLYGGSGYGGYGYGGSGYGYGYPGYGYYGYDPYATGYGAAYGPVPNNGSNPPGAAPATAAKTDRSTLDAARDFADKGEAEFKAANYQGAVYALRHAAVDDPNNPVVTLLLGQALFATGKFEQAAGATQAAMRQLPKEKWGVVISHYTELYGNTKDYTQQLRALEKATKEKPDDPALRFLAGFHYAHLGFTQPAIDQLDKGLKFAPRDEMARQLRDDLRGKIARPAVPPVPGVRAGPALETE